MITAELIFDRDCPNVEAARQRLRRALESLGLQPRWEEWARDDPQAPDHVRRYGSPTVLVNGRDVAGAPPSEGLAACRLYADGDGMDGVPPTTRIVEAIRRALEEAP